MVYERMIAEKQRIEKGLNLLEKKIDEFPEGKIFCTHHGKYYKWYYSDGKKQTYISKEEHHYAEQLAAKKYLSACQEELLQEKKVIEKYLYHHNSKFRKNTQFLLTDPAYQELLSPYFKPVLQELSSWAKSPYDQNNNYIPSINLITTFETAQKPLSGEVVEKIIEVE